VEEWVNQNKSAIIIGFSIIAAAVILAPKQQRYEAVSDHQHIGVYIIDKASGSVKKCTNRTRGVECTSFSR
jgi:hypothetical protein